MQVSLDAGEILFLFGQCIRIGRRILTQESKQFKTEDNVPAGKLKEKNMTKNIFLHP